MNSQRFPSANCDRRQALLRRYAPHRNATPLRSMSMQAASLEVLEKANLPPLQARAIVQAIEIEIAGARDTLATKQDVVQLRQEMSDMRHGLEIKLEGVRTEIHASASSISRQMYAALLGQMAVLLGVAYFFVAQLRR